MSSPDFAAILARHLERTDYRGEFIGCSCWDAGLPAVRNHRAHLAEVLAAETTIWLAQQRERIAEALSCSSVFGEMTRFTPDAHPDHNRWSWRGDGHGNALRDQYRVAADELLDALSAPEPADLEIAVDCPFCEAPAGTRCRARRSSNRAPFTHRQRLQVASTLSPTKGVIQ